MKDFRFREEVLSKFLHPRPGRIIRLAPPPERSQPDVDDLMPELAELRKIGGHGMVVKEASDHLRQPSPLFGDRPVHLPPQLLLDFLELGPHAVPPGFPLEQKFAPAAAAADMGETQEIESFRFTKPAPLAVRRSIAAELDQTGFVRVELQSELLEPSSHRTKKTASVVFMLPFDLVDDRIELRLPGVEDAQVQAATAAVEAGCGEAILGETGAGSSFPGWPQPVTVTLSSTAMLT